MEATEILFAFLRQHPRRSDLQRLLDKGEGAFEGQLRSVRQDTLSGGSPHRPRQDEQYSGEHRDAVRELSCQASSWNSFESGLPRVAVGVSKRVDRLRSLGNAVVPQVVELIGNAILTSRASLVRDADKG